MQYSVHRLSIEWPTDGANLYYLFVSRACRLSSSQFYKLLVGG